MHQHRLVGDPEIDDAGIAIAGLHLDHEGRVAGKRAEPVHRLAIADRGDRLRQDAHVAARLVDAHLIPPDDDGHAGEGRPIVGTADAANQRPELRPMQRVAAEAGEERGVAGLCDGGGRRQRQHRKDANGVEAHRVMVRRIPKSHQMPRT